MSFDKKYVKFLSINNTYFVKLYNINEVATRQKFKLN